jgi:hypothetical protein
VLTLRLKQEKQKRQFVAGEGMEALESEENPRELQDLRADRARKAKPV